MSKNYLKRQCWDVIRRAFYPHMPRILKGLWQILGPRLWRLLLRLKTWISRTLHNTHVVYFLLAVNSKYLLRVTFTMNVLPNIALNRDAPRRAELCLSSYHKEYHKMVPFCLYVCRSELFFFSKTICVNPSTQYLCAL